jgi:hypothetical protein
VYFSGLADERSATRTAISDAMFNHDCLPCNQFLLCARNFCEGHRERAATRRNLSNSADRSKRVELNSAIGKLRSGMATRIVQAKRLGRLSRNRRIERLKH